MVLSKIGWNCIDADCCEVEEISAPQSYVVFREYIVSTPLGENFAVSTQNYCFQEDNPSSNTVIL